jgi:ketosteroid isomerase-like protein
MVEQCADARAAAPQANVGAVWRYYQFVDAGRIDELLALFHEHVIYQRQGTPDIHGIAAMRQFYQHDRVIAAGCHVIDQVLAGGPWVAVRGNFIGSLKDGSEVDLRFTDWYHFCHGLITRRETLFPAAQV